MEEKLERMMEMMMAMQEEITSMKKTPEKSNF